MRLLPSQSFIKVVRKEIAWNPQRGLTALKAAISGMCALYLADAFNMPFPYWILISIVMVNQGSVGGSLEKVAGRVAGTISGMSIVLLPVIFFPQEKALYALFLATYLYVSALGYAGKAAPQGFMRASLYGAVIGFIGMQSPEMLPSYYGWRVLDVCLAGIIVLVVQAILLPVYAANDFQKLLTKNRKDLAAALRGLAEPAHHEVAAEALRQMAHRSGQTGEKLIALAKQSEMEGWDANLGALWRRKALGHFEKLLLLGAGLTSAGALPAGPDGAAKLCDKIHAVYLRCAEVLENELQNTDGNLGEPLHEIVAAMVQCYEVLRSDGELHGLSDEEIWAVHGNMQAATRFATLLETIQKSLAAVHAGASDRSGWAWDRIFATDPEGMAFALRYLVAAATMMWLVLALNWDNGVAAVISVCIITQSTLGRSYRKMTQRLVGCLLGGLAASVAMIFFIPHFVVLWQMALLLGVLMFGACYVAAGSPRFSYVGIQAALCMVILLVPDASQPSDLGGFWDRVTGIFMACLVSVMVSKLVFPVTSGGKIRELIRSRVHLLGDLFAKHLDAETAPKVASAHGETLRLTHAMYELDALLWEAGAEGDHELSAERVSKLAASLDAATCAVLAIPAVSLGEFPPRILQALLPPLKGLADSLRKLDTCDGEAIRTSVLQFETALKDLRAMMAFRELLPVTVRQVIGWAGLVREAGLRGADLADAMVGVRESGVPQETVPEPPQGSPSVPEKA